MGVVDKVTADGVPEKLLAEPTEVRPTVVTERVAATAVGGGVAFLSATALLSFPRF